MDWVFLAELAINGALTGLLYSLFAIGLVLIYKASSVPNLAQGGLTMVGAYVVLALSHDAGLPLWLAIPLAAVIMFGLGFGIERVALRRLDGPPAFAIRYARRSPGHYDPDADAGSRYFPAGHNACDLGRDVPVDGTGGQL